MRKETAKAGASEASLLFSRIELLEPIDDLGHRGPLFGLLDPHLFHKVDDVGAPLRFELDGRGSFLLSPNDVVDGMLVHALRGIENGVEGEIDRRQYPATPLQQDSARFGKEREK
jgi:hypothetical protein